MSETRDFAALMQARDRFVKDWCREHGREQASLSIEDVLAIRADQRWKNPDLASTAYVHHLDGDASNNALDNVVIRRKVR